MAEPEVIPFAVWSATTLAIIVVTGLVYRAYSRRKHDETASP